MIRYIPVSTHEHIHQIVELQQQNLAGNLTDEQKRSQGFVTLVHTDNVLQRMNNTEPSIIALDENKIAGYCLAMTESFAEEFPDLQPMYQEITRMQAENTLPAKPYITIGQVCVAQEYRGQGVFDSLYEAFKKQFSQRYAFAVTEVSARNQRSLQAHKRVGFTVIHTHPGGDWLTVLWDWSRNSE
ncbi:GNAT family N-acetyltransferase [Rhodocytophaga aerolata]|uniref:GNAT family N-acetyltransferase n=1 Tax=Rhodocytophaga aerolata TaxID=455078 RepID=A0ABT8R4K0_9BACT|nr:GNAT family N-acetyltransferase [Rhodocytophaga aerolata]MDO1446158.1 GNAT family N-acetyltransferase [Rhodocytophaga aerolata]